MGPPPSTWSKAALRAAAKRVYDDLDKGSCWLNQNEYHARFMKTLAAVDPDLKQAIAGLLSDFSQQTDFTETGSRNRPSSIACLPL